MGALGTVELIGADESFAAEVMRPALPGVQQPGAGSIMKREGSSASSSIEKLIADNLALSLERARARALHMPTSTTLAALAQALEMNGESGDASSVAGQALSMCRLDSSGRLLDPAAVRLALGVLFRTDAAEEGLVWARALPIGSHLRLVVGALLGDREQFEEAHAFVDSTDVPEREAVLGFLALKEGNDQRAVAHLRAALRQTPDDADSAVNLSIALWRLGSHRKAVSAARQAARGAPGRMDVAMRYFQLLLAVNDPERVDREVSEMIEQGVDAPARLQIVLARAALAMNDPGRALRILERAQDRAKAENDEDALVEVASNLIRLRVQHGKSTRDDSYATLLAMHHEYKTASVVVANLAQVAYRRRHAPDIRDAFEFVRNSCTPERVQFIQYQIATLEGDNAGAADHAAEWVRLDPSNLFAASAAMTALGIGAERWEEALAVALEALRLSGSDPIIINNAAYTFAMAGRPRAAIDLLEQRGESDFVLKATLGLAWLAAGEIQLGMKLYREAARDAEKSGDRESCSLMTEYQAMVVRQLGILDSGDPAEISAVALAPVPLPDDWSDRPEFLRLKYVADRHGYEWPLSL